MRGSHPATNVETKGYGKGKGGDKHDKRAEERTRTASFTNFAKGSRTKDIKDFINERL